MSNWSFFKSQPKPVLIAHRGACLYAPENTLSAFKLALDMGAKCIEFDVHQTKDGKVVVTHDNNLKRALGLNKKIKDLTFDEFSKRPIRDKTSKDYPLEFVPSLEETLDLIGRRAAVDVEIKGSAMEYPGIEEKTLEILDKKGYGGISFVSSFNIGSLRRLRELSANVPLAYLWGFKSLGGVFKEIKEVGAGALIGSTRLVNKTVVSRAHQKGLFVGVYTVNNKKLWDKTAKSKVDLIFTDQPDIGGLPEFEASSLGLTNGEW